MPQPRTKYDLLASAGYGFPLIISIYALTFAANTTGSDAFAVPLEFATEAKGRAAFTLSSVQVSCSAAGNMTTGTYQFTLTKIDQYGAASGVLATLTVPASPLLLAPAIDLRDLQGKGIFLKQGEGVRLDCGSAATGGSTIASGFRVRVFGESYGVSV